MRFEPITDDFNHSEKRFKITYKNKDYFIHITEEAWEDDFNSTLETGDIKNRLKMAVEQKIENEVFTERIDKVGVAYQAVLFTSGQI